MFVSFVIIVVMFLLVGCNTEQAKVSQSYDYKMDMKLKNLSVHGIGIIILEEKDLYTIEAEIVGRFHLFTFRTCSREIAIENADKNIFKRHKVKFNYRPNLIEKGAGCNAEIWGHDKDGKHTRGMVIFRSKGIDLPGYLICGGKVGTFVGTSGCQQRAGMRQSITFENPVKVKTKIQGCELEKEVGKDFEFDIKAGDCMYAFIEVAGEKRLHELYTHGYNKIMLKE
jgi:hypothetical protein